MREPSRHGYWARALLAAALATLALQPSGRAAEPAACNRICGDWQLDAAASDSAAPAIDKAMSSYKEDKPRRARAASPSDLNAMANAELEESLGPMRVRPKREDMRTQLEQQLVAIPELHIRMDEDAVVIDDGHGSPHRFETDEPFARVDSIGTATVKSQWQHGAFQVSEVYAKQSRSTLVSYAADARGVLTVTRTLVRPGLPKLVLRSVYRAPSTPTP